MAGAILLICLAVMLTFLISTVRSLAGETIGSDHPAHVFLARPIRKKGFRLFFRIPDLLNDCCCAAVRRFPVLCREACERVAYESDGFRLLFLEWKPTGAGLDSA